MSIDRDRLQAELSAHTGARDGHLANAAHLARQRESEIAQANAAEGARGAVARLLALCEEVPPVADEGAPVKVAALNGKAARKPAGQVEVA